MRNEHVRTMLSAYGLSEYIDGAGGGQPRVECAPAAFKALERLLVLADVIRDAGDIDAASASSEIDRLVLAALKEAM